MQIQMNTDCNIEGSEALATQVSSVVESALNRFSDHITRVEVHLSDENSKMKGGNDDMRCMMEARLEGRQPIAVTHQAATLDQAVDGAADKLTRVLTATEIIPGIKVDAGAKDMPGHSGEKVTEGLDGLRERLTEHSQMDARFAKWRAVIAIGDHLPSRGCIEANAHALARYAALCQEAGLVPIVEPEVLMDGEHTLQRCREVKELVFHTVFGQLFRQRVTLEGMLLKPNMVLPGLACPEHASVDEVAEAMEIQDPQNNKPLNEGKTREERLLRPH